MTDTINYGGRILEVEYDFEPAEEMVWTLPNGDPGYPGSDEVFDIYQVTYNGRNITAWLKNHDFEQIENIIRS